MGSRRRHHGRTAALTISRLGCRGASEGTAFDLSNRKTTVDLVNRAFRRDGPNQLWMTDIERHEAFLNRAVMEGHRRVLVAAGALKLRAA